MTVAIPAAPDEETPLLSGKIVSAIEGAVTEQGSEAATVAGPSSQVGRTSNTKGGANANGVSEAIKKTPLPWAQYSIVLFLQLAEPLTSQVIYPVSSTLDHWYHPGVSNRVPIFLVRTRGLFRFFDTSTEPTN